MVGIPTPAMVGRGLKDTAAGVDVVGRLVVAGVDRDTELDEDVEEPAELEALETLVTLVTLEAVDPVDLLSVPEAELLPPFVLALALVIVGRPVNCALAKGSVDKHSRTRHARSSRVCVNRVMADFCAVCFA